MATTEKLKKLYWIEDLLPREVISRRMHGGVGYYLDEKLVLILVDHGSSYEHKGISYPFVIWNGCLFPIETIKQGRVFMDYPFLENHPASAKWLYLPSDTDDFDENINKLLKQIKKRNPLFGLPIKAEKVYFDESEDISKPRLFSEAPPMKKTSPAKKKTAATKKPEKKIKADKKSENHFLLNVLKRKT